MRLVWRRQKEAKIKTQLVQKFSHREIAEIPTERRYKVAVQKQMKVVNIVWCRMN